MLKKIKPWWIAYPTTHLVVGMLIIVVALLMGMIGYHTLEHMSWVDAFVNAAMILSGMGPIGPLATTGGKIFAGCYALFSGLAFIVIIALIFTPLIHRFFVKVHLESMSSSKEKEKEN